MSELPALYQIADSVKAGLRKAIHTANQKFRAAA